MSDRLFMVRFSFAKSATFVCIAVVSFGEAHSVQELNRQVPIRITFCDLYKDPARYTGKMVSLRARINLYGGFGRRTVSEASFEFQNQCLDGYLTIGLEYPSEVKPRPDFDLVKDSAYQEYENAARRRMAIEATLEGRLDVSFVWRAKQRIRVGPGDGFGKKKWQGGRLVLRRISNVIAMPLPRK